MDELIIRYRKLLDEISLDFTRYLHNKIEWNERMLGIVGARGVGKTTLVLQHIKQHLNPQESLYVSADDLYFSTHTLLDLASDFAKNDGKYLFIDEVHKYPEWSRNLKLIYDYHPDLQIVFTGSSVLDILKGSSDLSRRAIMYKMYGLSFREYLNFFHEIKTDIYSLEDIVNQNFKINGLKHPLPLFKDYLKRGYYPFGKEKNYEQRLQQMIILSLETDIPQYANLNVTTARKLRKLLSIIAQSVPFKPNFTKISTMIDGSRNNIDDYFYYIEQAGLITQLRNEIGGLRALGKVEKVFLENPNLIYALAGSQADIGNIRETFFLNQMNVNHEVISSKVSDFEINEMTFEIGGKSKSQSQIIGLKKAFVVKDEIEYGYQNVIPLWAFGLNY